MKNIDIINNKLSDFRRKYHLNELLKGSLLLLFIGSLYLILILVLEKFLWLSSSTRTIIFWISILLAVVVFAKYILLPIIRMSVDKYKISRSNASVLIGNYFPEVSDQLINLLQFDTNTSSDLVVAAIEERAKNLSPFSFVKAVDFKSTFKFSKWLSIPVVLFLIAAIIFGFNWFKSPLDRVVNYNTAYTPPAPFKFVVDQNSLDVLEGNNANIKVTTVGKTIPENVKIVLEDKEFFLNKEGTSNFSYLLKSVDSNASFFLKSGNVRSAVFEINVLDAPSISDFKIKVFPPSYTKVKSSQYSDQGNLEVPVGSSLKFFIDSPKASSIDIIIDSIQDSFNKNKDIFEYKKRFLTASDYTILSSNKNVKDFEKLNYHIDILPDRSPIIKAEQGKDSTAILVNAFKIEVGDDYGFSKIEVVQTSGDDKVIRRIPLKRPRGILDVIEIDLDKNDVFKNSGDYSFYFEIFDNDQVNGAKSAKSETFRIKKNSVVDELVKNQNADDSNISNFDNSLEKLDATQKEFDEFNKLQKQKTNLDYKDKLKLQNLLEKQKEEQKELKKLNDKLTNTLKNLDKNQDTKKSVEALERMKEELERNNKLIDEIKKALSELKPKEAKKKMDELNKNNASSKKSLKQILDLTKRFYVIEKHATIIQLLELLAVQHDSLSVNNDLKFNKIEQEKLSNNWNDIQEELNELRRRNNALRRPMVLDDDKLKERTIGKEIESIKEHIKEKDIPATNKGQISAAAMLRTLAKKMSESPGGGGGMSMEELEEDKEMLRKVLDNLVVYSLDQEDNMNLINGSNSNNPSYSSYVKKQHSLKENFAHIDDSLFAIASRNPKIDLTINKLIEEVNYNIESSITRITDNKSVLGAVNMQYAIASSNELGLMISESILEMDKASKPKKGQGKPKDEFQLPDIIKKQESIQKAIEQLLKTQQQKSGDSKKKGESDKPMPGEKGSESKEGKDGEKGEKGSKSGEGKSGEGESGKQGNSSSGQSKEAGNKNGENGKPSDKSGNKPGEKPGKGKNGKGKEGEQGENGKKGEGKKQGDGSKKGEGDGEGEEGKDGESKGGKSDKGKGKKIGGNGEGDGSYDDENDLQQIFEIYKQQQDLRNQLEDAISKDGISPDEKRILDQMKTVEDELIENGFDTETTKRMQNLKHQLFKLKKAQFEQGKDDKRKSESSKKNFESNIDKTESGKVYYNSTEILNRQVLPLQSDYKKRVKSYFLK